MYFVATWAASSDFVEVRATRPSGPTIDLLAARRADSVHVEALNDTLVKALVYGVQGGERYLVDSVMLHVVEGAHEILWDSRRLHNL